MIVGEIVPWYGLCMAFFAGSLVCARPRDAREPGAGAHPGVKHDKSKHAYPVVGLSLIHI
eukprot:7236786-Prymnesium_polylepis.1